MSSYTLILTKLLSETLMSSAAASALPSSTADDADHVTGLYGKVYAAKHGEITEMLLQSNDFQNRRTHDSASSSTVILLLLSLCDPQIV